MNDRTERLRAASLALLDLLMPTPSAPAEPAKPPGSGLKARRRSAKWPRTNPLPVARTRWLQADIETAIARASQGDLSLLGQIYRAFARDGGIQGLLGTRTNGLVRLPRSITGDGPGVSYLQGERGEPGAFDAIFPPSELAQLDADGIVCGAGVAEFVQTEEDPIPVLTRLDPEFLFYRQDQDRWYFRSFSGLQPVTPGDGRWVLHTPAGRYEPWNRGQWQALGRSFIAKEHAFLYRENYSGKLANPARVAVAPQGATEGQKQGWFQKVMAWGVNSVFGLTPGYDVRLLESNGRGYEVFEQTIKTCDLEIMIALAGQVVTVTGGAGFANANIHATIRGDLIQGDGLALAATLNAQAIPRVLETYAPGGRAHVSWDTRPPADLKSEAESLTAAGTAIRELDDVMGRHGLKLDVAAVLARFGVPVLGDRNGDAVPDTEA